MKVRVVDLLALCDKLLASSPAARRNSGPWGITINNVQPGPVDTEMNPAEGEFADMLRK